MKSALPVSNDFFKCLCYERNICYFFASYHSGLLNVVILTILLALAVALKFVHWSVLESRLFSASLDDDHR